MASDRLSCIPEQDGSIVMTRSSGPGGTSAL
jgi:hypothetical protein